MDKQISLDLLQLKAVFFRPDEPFTWASGIKSPVYTDNRLTLSDPQVRGHVENGIAELVKAEFPEAEVLMGTATAGIAHAAIAAHILGMPMGYVRGSAKDHGRNNRIEGRLDKGQKVVIIEDLISTGGSVLQAAEALKEAGAEVLGVISIYTYNMEKGKKALADAGLKHASLTDFDTTVTVAVEAGYIRPEDAAKLLQFRDNPADESWMGGKA